MARTNFGSSRFNQTRLLAAALLATCASGVAQAAPDEQRWTTYASDTASLKFDYPSGVFTKRGGDPTDALKARTSDRAGRSFSTADGRARLQIGTFPNLDRNSVDRLRQRAIAASYQKTKLEYNRFTDTWYVLSGTRGAETYYERSHFSCNGRRIDVWTVTYPSTEARVFDRIVDEMARRFRQGLTNIRCG
jgi:hypothetical protein